MWCPAAERGHPITVPYEKARNWWIGSDPGLLRLRMATRTTSAAGDPERLRASFINGIKHWQVDYQGGCLVAH